MTAEPAKPRLCQPGKTSDNIKVDEELARLIIPLSANELKELHQTLDDEGCRDALIVWKDKQILVDGHNRIAYCREKGYPFSVIEKDFPNKDAAKAYIRHQQLGRRNLSPAAESYYRGQDYLAKKKQGARTDLTSGQSDQKSAAERLGKEHKVSEKTIRRDAAFAEAVDQIAENCGPEARNLLLSRDVGLTRGGIKALGKLPRAEQRKYVQALEKTGKRPRKPRVARKPRITVPAQPKSLVTALFKQFDLKDMGAISEAIAAEIKKRAK